MNKEILVWQCKQCKSLVVSFNWTRHDMNYCSCGKTACDFEEHYCRWVGTPLKAKRYDLEELLPENNFGEFEKE